jgi:RimJ/RimL family protein N-acetyltransferase
MLLRSITETELDRVLACTTDEPLGWIEPGLFRERLADGQYRPGLTWIAEDDSQILARAIWWLAPGRAYPQALDCVLVRASVPDRAGLAADLLGAAHTAFRARGMRGLPQYHIFLPTGWRDQPAAVAALGWRQEAARRAGLTRGLERLQYEWTPEAGLPARRGRLEFRPEPDDGVFLDAFRRVAEGSLDAATIEGRATVGADRQAREAMRFYLAMQGPRDWWRLGYTPDGSLAGLAIPSRNPDGPVVGYLGVPPELRGHGYVDDLLAEITRLLAAEGAQRIRADTDLANRPMAAAFERAGYRNFAIRMILSASPAEAGPAAEKSRKGS